MISEFEEDQFQAAIGRYKAEFEKRAMQYAHRHSMKIRQKARDYVDTFDQVQAIRYAQKRTPYWFVTINPKPEVTVEQLHDKIVEVLSQPEVSNPLWSYEIRQAPDSGLHAHLLFECHVINDNFCKRKIKAPFVPEICGTMKHVCTKWVSQEELPAVRSYIKKTIATKSKKSADKATKQWRLDNEIPSSLDEDHLLVWSSMVQNEPLMPPPETDREDNIIIELLE